jgi:uncharacterized membrane protein SpoIIM required for sporulation
MSADALALLGTAIAAAVGFGFAYFLVRMLITNIRTSVNGTERTTLVVVVATLALLALIGALITSSESAWAVTSLLSGALAGSLASQYEKGNNDITRSEVPPEPCKEDDDGDAGDA